MYHATWREISLGSLTLVRCYAFPNPSKSSPTAPSAACHFQNFVGLSSQHFIWMWKRCNHFGWNVPTQGAALCLMSRFAWCQNTPHPKKVKKEAELLYYSIYYFVYNVDSRPQMLSDWSEHVKPVYGYFILWGQKIVFIFIPIFTTVRRFDTWKNG